MTETKWDEPVETEHGAHPSNVLWLALAGFLLFAAVLLYGAMRTPEQAKMELVSNAVAAATPTPLSEVASRVASSVSWDIILLRDGRRMRIVKHDPYIIWGFFCPGQQIPTTFAVSDLQGLAKAVFRAEEDGEEYVEQVRAYTASECPPAP